MSIRFAQKEQTRNRIRAAIRVCFREEGFEATSIDDIAIRAGVGRATIYLHYSSKHAMLFDLLREDWRKQEELFGEIADIPAIDRASLRHWLRRLVEAVRTRNEFMGLYTFILSQDESVYRELVLQRDRLMTCLGRRLGAFQIVEPMDALQKTRRLAAHLMLFQIEQFCAFCAKEANAEEIELGTMVLAENLLRFEHGAETLSEKERVLF